MKLVYISLYILIVCILDQLALYFKPFEFFHWHHSSGFDFFKFIFWLILPLIIWRKDLEKRYFSLKGIQKVDYFLLVGVFVLSMLAMSLIPYIDSLKQYYMSSEKLSFDVKLAYAQKTMIWNFSWLIGYEFLFRYLLFKKCLEHNKYFYLITLFETIYHFNKPYPEMVGVFFLSIFLTYWIRLRKNFILPLFAHFLIELSLLLFILQMS